MMNTSSTQSTAANANGHARTDAVANLAHNLVDKAVQRLSTSEEKLRHTATDARATLNSSMQAARANCTKANLMTQSYVQRHPLRAIGFAVGIGAVIALLTRGKSTAPSRLE